MTNHGPQIPMAVIAQTGNSTCDRRPPTTSFDLVPTSGRDRVGAARTISRNVVKSPGSRSSGRIARPKQHEGRIEIAWNPNRGVGRRNPPSPKSTVACEKILYSATASNGRNLCQSATVIPVQKSIPNGNSNQALNSKPVTTPVL